MTEPTAPTVNDKLAELVDYVERARALPMSASCVVNRDEVLELVEEVRRLLPAEFEQAQYVIADRDGVVDEGQRAAQQILDEAYAERDRLVSRTEVATEAALEADRILAAAREQAELIRIETDDYVDRKLANFEVVLQKTMRAVERGRARLRGGGDMDALRDEDTGPVEPLPG